MLQYLPGFGSVTAGGSDDGSPINDFAEEPRDAPSPQMRLEAVSPRSAAMCSQRARIAAGSPARSPQSIRPGSSPVVFDSPTSASPTRLLQAERQYWAELTGRQVQELHEALHSKTDACLAAVDKMKQEIMERLRQDISSAASEFASLVSSLEDRLRREHHTDLQVALEAVRQNLPLCNSPKDGEDAKGKVALQPEVDGSGVPMPTSKLRQLDGLIEEIGLRVDGLHVKLEEDLTTALADERKTRGKAISDVCQYIEHVVALQESDAKSEKRRTDAAVAGLEDRVQVLEDSFNNFLIRPDAGTMIPKTRSSRPSGEAEARDISPLSEMRALSPTGVASACSQPAQTSNPEDFTLFSEEMRESLKHIVRKVGDTMSKEAHDSDGIRYVQRDPGLGSTEAPLASARLSTAAPAPRVVVRSPQGAGPCPSQAARAPTKLGGPAVVQTQVWFAPNGRQ